MRLRASRCTSGQFPRLTALLALAVSAGSSAAAFVPSGFEVNGRLVPRRWPSARLPLRFQLSDRPLSLLSNVASGSTLPPAIEGAMQAWSSAAGIPIRLEGTAAIVNHGLDGVNLITFADTPLNRDITANSVAITVPWTLGATGEAAETDIVFNPRLQFSTDGSADKFDVQGVLAHELGHALGLDHSPIAAATMWPFTQPGQTHPRTLQMDDVAGVRFLYSDFHSPSGGSLSGRVVIGDGTPVFGAHVTAVDGDGITQVGALSARDGSFTLFSLAVGGYQVYAEPLDGPVTPGNLGSTFRDARRTFRTAFAGGNPSPSVAQVAAGKTTSVGDLRVEAQQATLNPLWIGWSPNVTVGAGATALQIQSGSTGFMVVLGDGMSSVPTDGFRMSGGDLVIPANRVQQGISGGLPFAIMPFTIRAGATPGPRSFHVIGPDERAAFTGGIEVVAP